MLRGHVGDQADHQVGCEVSALPSHLAELAIAVVDAARTGLAHCVHVSHVGPGGSMVFCDQLATHTVNTQNGLSCPKHSKECRRLGYSVWEHPQKAIVDAIAAFDDACLSDAKASLEASK